MRLWIEWFGCGRQLRSACSRRVTFMWLVFVLAAMAIRPDLLGVTSFVRASFLHPACYHLLLNFFHSKAVSLRLLLNAWVLLVFRLFEPVTEEDCFVFAADGLKVAKEGKKMPAVKYLFQSSADNSKSAYIMGHSFQVVALLVRSKLGHVFAVPLLSRICEGLDWGTHPKRLSLLDKMASLFLQVAGIRQNKALLVADAYYASRTMIEPLFHAGHHLVTKAKINSVAYYPADKPKQKKRGRPRIYAKKVQLRQLFKGWQAFKEAPSPVYDEKQVVIKYRAIKLMWRPVGRLVQFVLVKHPTRGKMILLSTKLDMDPLAVIRTYGLRFKIEVSFKQAIYTLGTYAYHFWMKDMTPIKRGSGDQVLATRSPHYKMMVQRKMDAYHRYVQVGCIVQGLLQHLAINFRAVVWAKFGSWLRTMKTDMVPSEMVVSCALKSTFCGFLLDGSSESELKKFILDHANIEEVPGLKMAG